MTRTAHLSLLFILLLSISSISYAAMQVASLRIADHPQKTRVVFDLKGAGEARVSMLQRPSRLVIRFPDAKKGLRYTRKQIQSRWIKRIRTGWGKKGYLVVLDLKKPVQFNAMRLPKRGNKPSRLVIDLTSVSTKVAKRKDDKPSASQSAKRSLAQRTLEQHQQQEKLKQQLLELTARPMKARELVVAIDAGHGGKDAGATGVHGVKEKDVTLAMARELKRMIDAEPGMRAVLIRKGDEFIPLEERPKIAKRKHADLFISIHADAFPYDRRVRGGSVFVLSREGASSAMAKLLAQRENRSLFVDTGNKKQVAYVLGDLVRKANLRASRQLGKMVLRQMAQKVHMHKLEVQAANFAVLRNLDMPSILIETAFISNPKDVRNLRSRRFHRQFAAAVVKGVKQFAATRANKPLWGERLYVYYKVKPGDNLSTIAARFGVKQRQLRKLNRLHNPNLLYVGKRLKIPVSDKLLATL